MIDIKEELVSDVGMSAEFTEKGLSMTFSVDGEDIHEVVYYEDMAVAMLGDNDKYPDEVLLVLSNAFEYLSRMLKNGINNG